MIEIIYSIDDIEMSMFAPEAHTFYLSDETWVTAETLNVKDKIFTRCGTLAEIININQIDDSHHVADLKICHNHNYFLRPESMVYQEKICDKAPLDPLNLVAYKLANRPSNLPNGTPTGAHAGPWAAARYFNSDTGKEIVGWGCANDSMCAEDAAVNNLRVKLGDAIGLHRGNVKISYAYVRIYKRVRGRIVNKISPCDHCRNNYGDALNDKTVGKSNLSKDERGYLASEAK
jgi:hypothetical protein